MLLTASCYHLVRFLLTLQFINQHVVHLLVLNKMVVYENAMFLITVKNRNNSLFKKIDTGRLTVVHVEQLLNIMARKGISLERKSEIY